MEKLWDAFKCVTKQQKRHVHEMNQRMDLHDKKLNFMYNANQGLYGESSLFTEEPHFEPYEDSDKLEEEKADGDDDIEKEKD